MDEITANGLKILNRYRLPAFNVVNLGDYEMSKTSLDSYNDPDAISFRQQILKMVSPESIIEWDSFIDEWREKAAEAVFGSCNENKKRTYPVKEKSHLPFADSDENSDVENNKTKKKSHVVTFDNKYKLVRKIESTVSTTLAKAESDSKLVVTKQIPHSQASSSSLLSIDQNENNENIDENAIKRQLARERLASIMQRKARTEDVLGEQVKFKPKLKSESIQKYGYVSDKPTETDDSRSSPDNSDCVLFKYGHCNLSTECPYNHIGSETQSPDTKTDNFKNEWEHKPQSVDLCRGYLDLSCWNLNCNYRHVVYETDCV